MKDTIIKFLRILKKIIHGIIFFCGLMFIAILALLSFSSDKSDDGGGCGTQLIDEIPSPNGKLKAIIFTHDCGATTSTSTHIAIVSTKENIVKMRYIYSNSHVKRVTSVNRNHDDRVPLNDIGGPKVYVKWLSNRELEVQYPEFAILPAQTSFLLTEWLKIKYTKY